MGDLKIETDQKPLVTLLGRKSLDDLPPRIVRLTLTLMRYKFTIMYLVNTCTPVTVCRERQSQIHSRLFCAKKQRSTPMRFVPIYRAAIADLIKFAKLNMKTKFVRN